MKKIIISASDETFASHLFELIKSLHQFTPPLADGIGVFDLGMTEDTKIRLRSIGIHLIQPDWDFDLSNKTGKMPDYLKALTVRPFLPTYFPGYDLYLWLDADTWVQTPSGVESLFGAAETHAMAVAPQIHPSYVHDPSSLSWRSKRLSACFGTAGAGLLANNIYYNSGVFALHKDAPHWSAWEAHFSAGLIASKGQVICDQTAINYALWTEDLAVQAVPALCNWCCHLRLPAIDKRTGFFCVPKSPNEHLGIVHMTGSTKKFSYKIPDVTGTEVLGFNFKSHLLLRNAYKNKTYSR